MQSYKHFTLVFLVFILCGIFSRYRDSKKDGEKITRNKTKTRWEDLMNIYL
jgi:uncharacterized membrane protein